MARSFLLRVHKGAGSDSHRRKSNINSMTTKTSEIWNFFTKLAADVAKCLYCEAKLSCKNASTKGLWDHFKSMHAAEYEKRKETPTTLKKTQSITKFLKDVDPQKKADEQIASLMIRQNCSFYFVEAPELINLFKMAYPKLELRRREYFRRKVIPDMASNIQQKITERIGTDFFAVTSDGWSQITKSPSLLSITVHHISATFERSDFVLDVIPMDGHTGAEIATAIEESLEANGFTIEKVICLVRDNARNMQCSANLLELNSFQCACHFLHLIMGDVLKMPELAMLVSKVRTWVTYFRTCKGSRVLEKFQSELKSKNKKLISACPTRWNSTYAMLVTFREQKKVLLAIEADRRGFGASQVKRAKLDTIPDNLPNLEPSDFDFLRELCPVMEIFNRETEKFSREASSASTVIPTAKKLRDFLVGKIFSRRIEPIVEAIVNSLNERVRAICGNHILRVSMLLDPRFAYNDLFSLENWKIIEQQLIELAKTKSMDPQNELGSENRPDPAIDELDLDENANLRLSESSDESIEKYNIWSQPKSPCGITLPSTISGEADSDLTSKIESQLAQYKAGQRLSIDGDLFKWWRENSERLPELAKLARMLHCIPATSICSERLFSKAGLLYANTLRNKLSGKTARQILLVKANLDNVRLAPAFCLDSDDESEDEE